MLSFWIGTKDVCFRTGSKDKDASVVAKDVCGLLVKDSGRVVKDNTQGHLHLQPRTSHRRTPRSSGVGVSVLQNLKLKKGFWGPKKASKIVFFLFGPKGGHVTSENISPECKLFFCLCLYLCAGTMLQGI